MRKTFIRKVPLNAQMNLQITSMADIFMIILVFLLKSYGAGAIDVTPSPDLSMAQAQPGNAQTEGLKLEVAETAVRVEGQAVSKVKDFTFVRSDLAGNGSSRSLSAALLLKKQQQPGSQVIILADRRAPYSTIKTVLASAAASGFTDFKFAVVNPN